MSTMRKTRMVRKTRKTRKAKKAKTLKKVSKRGKKLSTRKCHKVKKSRVGVKSVKCACRKDRCYRKHRCPKNKSCIKVSKCKSIYGRGCRKLVSCKSKTRSCLKIRKCPPRKKPCKTTWIYYKYVRGCNQIKFDLYKMIGGSFVKIASKIQSHGTNVTTSAHQFPGRDKATFDLNMIPNGGPGTYKVCMYCRSPGGQWKNNHTSHIYGIRCVDGKAVAKIEKYSSSTMDCENMV